MSNDKRNTINFTFWWFDPPFGQKWPKMAKKVFFFFFFFFSFFFCSIIILFQLISFMVMRNHVKNTINFKFWWFDPPKGSKRAKKAQKIGKLYKNQGFLILWLKLSHYFWLGLTLKRLLLCSSSLLVVLNVKKRPGVPGGLRLSIVL